MSKSTFMAISACVYFLIFKEALHLSGGLYRQKRCLIWEYQELISTGQHDIRTRALNKSNTYIYHQWDESVVQAVVKHMLCMHSRSYSKYYLCIYVSTHLSFYLFLHIWSNNYYKHMKYSSVICIRKYKKIKASLCFSRRYHKADRIWILPETKVISQQTIRIAPEMNIIASISYGEGDRKSLVFYMVSFIQL